MPPGKSLKSKLSRRGPTRSKMDRSAALNRDGIEREISTLFQACCATPVPRELLPLTRRAESSTVGSRRAKGQSVSEYAASGARAERRGEREALVDFARRALKAVEIAGVTLSHVVQNGTLDGWHLRQALSHAAGAPLATWDGERGRTVAERQALLARTLAELGSEVETPKAPRRGGWSVSS